MMKSSSQLDVDFRLNINFQAHRGSVDEAPENTVSAIRHAWRFEGSIPEIDIRTTRDNSLICLHDNTLARTTNAPNTIKNVDVSKLTLKEIRQWDAGIKLGPRFAGERVATLIEIFEEMRKHPENRKLFLEVKSADLYLLKEIIQQYNVEGRLLFIHEHQHMLSKFIRVFPKIQTMTWCSGNPDQIKQRFEEFRSTNFKDISLLQFHLHVRQRSPEITYLLEPDFLKYAQEQLKTAGVELQLRPFAFDHLSLYKLIAFGVRWFVTDSPEKFNTCLQEVQGIAG
jgi:glycerophosphoryl diester phosphodiesterase